ncbi:hypothetical protein E4631_04335 [Hymenobacter sp. UV11]|uniref:hypothetical protein n=1 Tax=Hymenobacter sp. UV11 TaxID=1849735 RepID=UPI00106098C4|nr:hypothetical protein [Hymenobacter sp. UV11]TFZ68222.1 hypothetical protein E4631_04335 [Hymenobacter sp. UV11]
MKSFLKTGFLFALIVAGRYMQLTTPAATAGLAKPPVQIFAPDTTTLTLAHYLNEQPVLATPVNQREAVQPTTWF